MIEVKACVFNKQRPSNLLKGFHRFVFDELLSILGLQFIKSDLKRDYFH